MYIYICIYIYIYIHMNLFLGIFYTVRRKIVFISTDSLVAWIKSVLIDMVYSCFVPRTTTDDAACRQQADSPRRVMRIAHWRRSLEALARSFDVVSDPVMSYVTDSCRSNVGRRLTSKGICVLEDPQIWNIWKYQNIKYHTLSKAKIGGWG